MSGSQGITNIFADIFHMTAGKKIVGTLSAVPPGIDIFGIIVDLNGGNCRQSGSGMDTVGNNNGLLAPLAIR